MLARRHSQKKRARLVSKGGNASRFQGGGVMAIEPRIEHVLAGRLGNHRTVCLVYGLDWERRSAPTLTSSTAKALRYKTGPSAISEGVRNEDGTLTKPLEFRAGRNAAIEWCEAQATYAHNSAPPMQFRSTFYDSPVRSKASV
jgi:hypothetical protein